MLDSAIPYYQSGLRNRLCYEITFNEYGKVINASGQVPTPDAMYKTNDIALEYKIVTQLDLAKIFQKNTKEWFCCVTELSGKDKFQCISRTLCGIGHLMNLVSP